MLWGSTNTSPSESQSHCWPPGSLSGSQIFLTWSLSKSVMREIREHMNPLFPQVWRHFPLGSPGYILEQENFYSSITFLLPSWATTCIVVTLQEQCFQGQRRKTRLLPSSNANTGWVVWACLFSFLLEFFWDQPQGYNLSSKVSSSWRTSPNYSVKAQGSRIGKVGKKRYRTIKWPSNRNRDTQPAHDHFQPQSIFLA